MGKYANAVIAVALVVALVIPTACAKLAKFEEGVLPTLSIGDRWVSRVVFQGVEYTMTSQVSGEEVSDGNDCYVIDSSINPPFMGLLGRLRETIDKATMFPATQQMSGEYMDMPLLIAISYAHEFLGERLYPLAVGKEIKVIEAKTTTRTLTGETETNTVAATYTYKVDKMEQITVPAGTFRCFKIIKFDEANTVVSSYWTSDQVKQIHVKSLHHETGEVHELLSYSIS